MRYSDRPGFIPPYQDVETLSAHISIAPRTIDEWVKLGKLPAPKVRGGKRLWSWAEVKRYLEGDGDLMPPSADLATRITEATRHAIAAKER